MTLTMLVPLDGSPEAARGILLATSLASAAGPSSRLCLVRAVQSSVGPGEEESGPAQARAVEEARDYLRSVAAPLTGDGLDVSTSAVYGPAIHSILNEVDAQGANLVVMATHGRWGMERLARATIAQAIVAGSPVPVSLLGPNATPRDAVRRLMVPLDGGPFAAATLPQTARLAEWFHVSAIHLVGVVPPVVVHLGDDAEGEPPAWAMTRLGLRPSVPGVYVMLKDQPEVVERRRELEHALEFWADELRSRIREVHVHVDYGDRHPTVASSVIHAATELGADLIAIRTHARQGVSRWFLGSVADEIVRESTVPTVLYSAATVALRA